MTVPDAGAPAAKPMLFLSHSGADTGAARALKRRLEKAAADRGAALKVWFDKDDLRPGYPWTRQIEEAIGQATAFAVYLGSNGVVNWVEAEVDLALSRANCEGDDFAFVPIISAEAPAGASALPGFARRFHGVRDVENDEAEFEKLLAVALGRGAGSGHDRVGTTRPEIRPFFGLQAIDEERSHLFYGREKETERLVRRVRERRLVLVVGDSGSGKSSLVKAGLIPRWRGGAVAELEGRRPNEEIWHVIEFRPGSNPRRRLRNAVFKAACALHRSEGQQQAYVQWAMSDDPELRRQGLRCGLDPERTRTLVVVDQLDELVTLTPKGKREPFVELLLDLAEPGDEEFSVAMTMRGDYYNLLTTECPLLRDRLEAEDRAAFHRIDHVEVGGLSRIVTEPLRLAGIQQHERESLSRAVLHDVGARPGDLALVQFALTRAWDRREEFGDLLHAYTRIGRVDGALANEAERVFEQQLGGEANSAEVSATLIRLARLESIAGPSRRVAQRREFSERRWNLLQTLAGEKGNRLALICERRPDGAADPVDSEETAEIAHEALLTRWPRLHSWLNEAPDEKRRLDRLADIAAEWADAATPEAKSKLLVGTFGDLARERPSWLSAEERAFVDASEEHHAQQVLREEEARALEKELRERAERAHAQERRLREQAERARERERGARRRALVFARVAAVLAVVASAASAAFYLAERKAIARQGEAFQAQAAGLASAADRETKRGDAATALLLALQPLLLAPADSPRGRTSEAERAAYAALLQLREGAVLRGHEGPVFAVAFSPMGDRFATGGGGASARLWNARDGRLISELNAREGGRGGSVLAVAFSSDGRRLATSSSDGAARVWDAQDGRLIGEPLHEGRGAITSVAFSPDGRLLATGSQDGAALLWDAQAGERVAVLPGRENGLGGPVRAVAFSPDGRLLATGSQDGAALLWDVQAGERVAVLPGHTGAVVALAFSPDDGRLLATGSQDGAARLWGTRERSRLHVLSGNDGWVLALAFSPDGRLLATGSQDGAARLWDARNGQELAALRGHEDEILALAFSPDGGRVATGSWDGTARLWDARDGHGLAVLRGHESERGGPVLALAFSPDGERLATGSQDGTARLWDARADRGVAALTGHGGPVTSVAFSPDGRRLATGSQDRTARLWDAEGGGRPAMLGGHGGPVTSVAFSPDGRLVAAGSEDGSARLRNPEGHQVGPPLGGRGGPVRAVAFSPDGRRLAAGLQDGSAWLWDTEGRQVGPLPGGHDGPVTSMAFSPDGRRLAAGLQDGSVRLWGARDRRSLRFALAGDRGPVTSVAFAPDGKRLATGSQDGEARLWDARNGQELAVLHGQGGEVRALAFSPDGRLVAVGSDDGAARLWDAESGRRLAVLDGHGGPVTSVAFSPDGRRLATGSQDRTARLWHVFRSRSELVDAAAEKLPRCSLSPSQRIAAGLDTFGLAGVAEHEHADTEQPVRPCRWPKAPPGSRARRDGPGAG